MKLVDVNARTALIRVWRGPGISVVRLAYYPAISCRGNRPRRRIREPAEAGRQGLLPKGGNEDVVSHVFIYTTLTGFIRRHGQAGKACSHNWPSSSR